MRSSPTGIGGTGHSWAPGRAVQRRFGEGRPRFSRLFALPLAGNAASRRALEKAGSTLDAVLRRSAVKEGRLLDQAPYSLALDGAPWPDGG